MKKPSTNTDLYFACFFTISATVFMYLLWHNSFGPKWLLALSIAGACCIILKAWYAVVMRLPNPAYQEATLYYEQDEQDFHAFVCAMDEDRYWALCDEVRPHAFKDYLFEIYEREAKPTGAKYTGLPVCTYP
jgi:hypothetical protein